MAFGSFAVDPITHVTRIAVLGSTLPVVVLAAGRVRGHPRESEHYVLILLSALGTMVLGASADLLVVVAAYLLASLPAYALAGFGKDAAGTEAALKYYLMGALLGVLMLGGVTLLSGVGRGTAYPVLRAGLAEAPPAAVAAGLVALLAGLLFKAGAVPGHFWVPDVTEGAPPPSPPTSRPSRRSARWPPSTGSEPGPAGRRPVLLAVVAAATMTLGNLAAFAQDNVRRLLAYSTVAQAGYLLVPVAMADRSDLAQPALLYYLGAYAVTNVGAFAVVLATGRDDLGGYAGLMRGSPPRPVPRRLPPRVRRHAAERRVRREGPHVRRGRRRRTRLARRGRGREHGRERLLLPALDRPAVPAAARRARPARGASAVAVTAALASVALGVGSGLVLP